MKKQNKFAEKLTLELIEQEIKMYEDDPFFKMYDGIIYNSFNV